MANSLEHFNLSMNRIFSPRCNGTNAVMRSLLGEDSNDPMELEYLKTLNSPTIDGHLRFFSFYLQLKKRTGSGCVNRILIKLLVDSSKSKFLSVKFDYFSNLFK